MQRDESPDPHASKERLVGPRRGMFVHVAIALTAVLVVGIIALMLWRWLQTSEPTLLIVVGNESLEGARAEVQDIYGNSLRTVPLIKANQYYANFPLQPGDYVVIVSLRDDQIMKQNLRMGPKQRKAIELRPLTTEDDRE